MVIHQSVCVYQSLILLLHMFFFLWHTGLSNIIGIIVYISANTGDPNQSQSKKNNYSYGWSFYFGALSFILAEMVGVLAVRIYIQNHRLERARLRPDFLKKSTLARLHPSYLYGLPPQSPSPCSSRSSEDACSPPGSPIPQQQGIPSMQPPPPGDIALYTLGRDGGKVIGLSDAAFLSPGPGETPPGDASFLHSRNCVHPDMSDSVAVANRRTTPV
uniref:Uncharacterized protein n=1 Tax=Eptatretus burgeri TaxID=7764 RepID=A0A8C4R2L6_EPTBU